MNIVMKDATRQEVGDYARDAVAVTASDATNDPGGPFYSLYVGGAGAVKLTTLAGTDVTLSAVPVGTTLKIGCRRVWSTGTTATLVIGLK